MRQAGLAVELLKTRHVRNALKTMPVKTDRNDARGIAQLMRLGWFRPVHCKSIPTQETRALLAARKLVQVQMTELPGSVARQALSEGQRRKAKAAGSNPQLEIEPSRVHVAAASHALGRPGAANSRFQQPQ